MFVVAFGSFSGLYQEFKKLLKTRLFGGARAFQLAPEKCTYLLTYLLTYLRQVLQAFGSFTVQCQRNSLSLSLRFNGHFPGEPGLAGVH